MKHRILFLFSVLLSVISIGYAQPLQVQIDVKKDLGKINPGMYGVFFEDINLGADGGIYAEMIKNRSFEFFKTINGMGDSSKERK